VKDITGHPKDAVIANAIIQLAHSLGCRVLAEGVETELQSDYLHQQGCDLVQGFFYGRPVPAQDFEQILARGEAA
jgi:EAL domain-containing protein (putative c-di-GMP-specific phosphodiesterase class I)